MQLTTCKPWSCICINRRVTGVKVTAVSQAPTQWPVVHGQASSVKMSTSRALRSGLRRESEGRDWRPLPLLDARAKWVKPYLSPIGFGAHCRGSSRPAFVQAAVIDQMHACHATAPADGSEQSSQPDVAEQLTEAASPYIAAVSSSCSPSTGVWWGHLPRGPPPHHT